MDRRGRARHSDEPAQTRDDDRASHRRHTRLARGHGARRGDAARGGVAARYRTRYPNAKLYAPAGSRTRIEKLAKVDATYESYARDDTTSLDDVDGLAQREGVLVVRSKRGTTYVMNDALFNMPHGTGLSGFVLKHVTQSTGGPRVSRTARIALVADRAKFRAALEKLAEDVSVVRVLVAHHVPIEGDVSGALRGVAATL